MKKHKRKRTRKTITKDEGYFAKLLSRSSRAAGVACRLITLVYSIGIYFSIKLRNLGSIKLKVVHSLPHAWVLTFCSTIPTQKLQIQGLSRRKRLLSSSCYKNVINTTPKSLTNCLICIHYKNLIANEHIMITLICQYPCIVINHVNTS